MLGTSASCPVIAGILAHVNDYRLSSDLPPLGFVNPLIYQNADKFTDVTKGYNAGCDLSGIQIFSDFYFYVKYTGHCHGASILFTLCINLISIL